MRLPALLLVLLVWTGTALAQSFPELTGRVVDQARILDAATIRRLTEDLLAHERATSNQVVVVTLTSLEGYEIADYGYRLGRHWGIGQADKDNGVLLIVAPNERRVRIEVGYGLEGDLPDALAKTIIDREILPHFRGGDVRGGVRAGTAAILAAVQGAYVAPPEPERESKTGKDPRAIFFGILMALLFLGFSYLSIRQEARTGWGKGSRRDIDVLTRPTGGFGGFGGGGGGGFSGGGGGFGGGGASGGW